MDRIYLDIAIILISTKVGGIVSRRFKMPQVLGALIAGVIIGPSLLDLIAKDSGPYITLLSNLGVIMLMFLAGLETDLEEFKKAGLSSFLIAVGGVIVPLVFGTISAYVFSGNFWENLFIGVILTATSVSISVETLNELGKLNTRAGTNILGAAVIDDVIGLLAVSLVLSLAVASKHGGHSAKASADLVKACIYVVIFCGGSLLMLKFLPKLINKYTEKKGEAQRLAIYAIAIALIFAFIAEKLGIASITGAYVFGLILSPVANSEFIAGKVHYISSYFLTPVFFASVGLATNLKLVNRGIIVLTILMLITAVFGKIIGCGVTAKLYGMSNRESMQIGVGMISRGEVALITTTLGLSNGIISQKLYIPTLIVVVATTLITPILLKFAFSESKKELI
jgi:Kef-type K+ transport system membrane component KefB